VARRRPGRHRQGLLDGKAYDAAEPLLRESLSLGEKPGPDAWDTHHARALLGGALLGQRKYAAAEPLLLTGYEGEYSPQIYQYEYRFMV